MSVVEALAPLAARGHGLYSCDQVGSGLSERLTRPKDHSFLGHVAGLEAIVRDEIRAERVILVGFRTGGWWRRSMWQCIRSGSGGWCSPRPGFFSRRGSMARGGG